MTASPPELVPTWVDRDGYPFASRVAEGRVHHVDEGQGEPLLFVHGTPTWSYEWRHLIRALVPSRRCIAPYLARAVRGGRAGSPAAAAGHWPHEEAPEAVALALGEFLEATG